MFYLVSLILLLVAISLVLSPVFTTLVMIYLFYVALLCGVGPAIAYDYHLEYDYE